MNSKIENIDPIQNVLSRLPLPAHVKAIPLALHQTLRGLAALEQGITEVERERACLCARLTADALARTGDDCKSLATNETTRKALVEQTCAEDTTCAELLADVDRLKRERALALADAEALRIAVRLLSVPSPTI
jgi:hypothetical protein